LATALAILAATSLGAQQPEPTTLGIQVRAAFPSSGLSTAAGGSLPGAGASLVMEDDLVEYFEGWRVRCDLGGDSWFLAKGKPSPASGKVSEGHVSGELVRMLRPGGDPVTLGPFLVVGLGIYEWSYHTDDPVLGVIHTRTGHVAGTLGFGWRMNQRLDIEAKVVGGMIDQNWDALAFMATATWRF
jgi:hypothetical protein